MLALIFSSVCLFKLAHPIFLFIESIRLVLLRSRDVVMEQVKQTFRFFLSFSRIFSPDNFSALTNSFYRKYFFLCAWLYRTHAKTNGNFVLFFFEISSLWEVWTFCSSNFKFFANNLKLKNELSLLRVVHYENDETSTQLYTYLFLYICVCVRMCNTRGLIGCCLRSTTIRTSC